MLKLINTKGTEFEQNGSDLAIIDTEQRAAKPIMVDASVLDTAFINADEDVKAEISFDVDGEDITVSPSTQTQVIAPSAGKNAILKVTVNPVTASIDPNITADNIKKDINILGVTGTLDALFTPTQKMSFASSTTDISYEVAHMDVTRLTNIGGWFSKLSKITSVDCSHWHTSQITDINYLFEGCTKLESIDVHNWDVSNVEQFYNAFQNCKALTELDLSGWDTSSALNFNFLFSGCIALQKLDIRNFVFYNVDANTLYMFGQGNASTDVPDNCLIIVKDDSIKATLQYKFPRLTNIKTVAEYEAQ